LVSIDREVLDERGSYYSYIDVSGNTNTEPITLWIAQRNHLFTWWWKTYIGV
jgi:hypothetical protein